MKWHCTPTRMTKIQKTNNSKWSEDVEQQEFLFIAGGNAKWYSHFGRKFWQVLIKLNVVLSYDSSTAFLVTYPNELKKYVHRNTCSFILNCPKLEATKSSLKRKMDKQTVVHLYSTILSSD